MCSLCAAKMSSRALRAGDLWLLVLLPLPLLEGAQMK